MTLKEFINNKYIKLLIKVSVSLICLFVLFKKINFSDIAHTIQHAQSHYLVLAGFFFVVSKLFSAVRLQHYLQSVHLYLNHKENIKLYWLGMFYNLFLPGGIGGDAYKAYYLNKQFKEVKLKNIISTLLKDRLSGLVTICMMLLIMSQLVSLPISIVWVVIGFFIFIFALFLTEKMIAPDTTKQIFFTTTFSLLVQMAQLLCIVFILLSLGIHENFLEVLFVFLLSTIVAMFPVSIGGIGLRELTFLYFADYFHHDKEISVSIAFLFFVITSIVSLPGIYYHFRQDKLRM